MTVPFLHIESSVMPPLKAFYEGLHFFFLHWWAMNNIWGHYDLEAWKFDNLTMLCAVWFTFSVLRDLFLKPWADQHLLTFKINVKVKLEFLTVACNSSILVIIIKRFRFYRNLLLFFEFRYYPYYYYYYYYSFFFRTRDWNHKSRKPKHIQPPNSTHTLPLIRHISARVSVLIRITVLDLEPDPCFQIFPNISKTNYRIFNCNISNRRSVQELPFIFFELRAATCLWGRYDPKTENFTFLHISPPHPFPFSTIFGPCIELPKCYISCSGC